MTNLFEKYKDKTLEHFKIREANSIENDGNIEKEIKNIDRLLSKYLRY